MRGVTSVLNYLAKGRINYLSSLVAEQNNLNSCEHPSNTWFLGSTRVSLPNGILIG